MYTQEIMLALGFGVIVLALCIVRIEMRLRKLLRGNRAETIEESLTLIEQDIKTIKHFKKEVATYLETAEKRLSGSIRGVGTIRFNPFKGDGSGGNQSFASSFVSEKGNGVTLSTLYSRDHVSIFAKPLKNFVSEFELTKEEKESLVKAREAMKPEQK